MQQYETYELRERGNVPAFDTYWPAGGQCAPRHLYDVARDTGAPPTSTTMWYEPYQETSWKPNTKVVGRTHSIPPFVMTPYARGSKKTYRYLTRRLDGMNGIIVYRQYGSVSYDPRYG